MASSLEIFSGVGGLAHGLELSGVQHKAFVEINKDACNSLLANYGGISIFNTDIQRFNYDPIGTVDIVAGGPPCQPFSLGGKGKGLNDDRDMFPEAVRAIRETQPKVFIFENVKGLLRDSFATYFNYIILQLSYPHVIRSKNQDWSKHLEQLEIHHTKNLNKNIRQEYSVVFRMVNAADYGIPQKRERVFIIGIRKDIKHGWSFPSPTHSEESLFWSKYVTGTYWDKHKVPKKQQQIPTERMLKKIDLLKSKYGLFPPIHEPWVTTRDVIYDLPDPQTNVNYHKDHFFRSGAKIYPGHTGSHIDEPSKTIKAGDHGVPGGENMLLGTDGSVRYFTVLEAKRIQTFPDDYIISGSWTEAMRQIGNAVPVKLANIISRSLVTDIL